jgi:hypothetical protein
MLFTRKHDVNIPPLYMNDDVALKRALNIQSKVFVLTYFMMTLWLIVLVTIASVIVLIERNEFSKASHDDANAS